MLPKPVGSFFDFGIKRHDNNRNLESVSSPLGTPLYVVFVETQMTYGDVILFAGNRTRILSNIQVAAEIALSARESHNPRKD